MNTLKKYPLNIALILFASFCFLIQQVPAENWVSVPDDYEKIEDAMKALAPEGGRILISPGSYSPTSYLIDRLEFNTDATLILEAEDEGVIIGGDMELVNFYLQRIEFHGINFISASSFTYAIIRVGSNNAPTEILHRELVIDNCRIDGSRSDANLSVWIQYIDRVQFTNSQIIVDGPNLTNGFRIDGAKDITISNCLFLYEKTEANDDIESRKMIDIDDTQENGRIEITGNQARALSVGLENEALELVTEIYVDAQGGELIISGNNMPFSSLVTDYKTPTDTVIEITGNRFQGINMEVGRDSTAQGGSLKLHDNLFHQNIKHSDACGPFSFYGPHDRHFKLDVQHNTFIKDTSSGCAGRNVFLFNNSALTPASDLAFKNNNFMLSADPEMYNYSKVTLGATGDLDVRNNYWGHPSGPNYRIEDNGLGCIVWSTMLEGELLYKPFLGAPASCGVESYLGDPLDFSPTDTTPDSENLWVELDADNVSTTSPATITLQAMVGDGLAPYEYHWFVNGQLLETQTEATLTHDFETPEFHIVRVEVIDAEKNTASDAITIDTTSPRAKILCSIFQKDQPDEIVQGARVSLLDSTGKEIDVQTTDNYGAVQFRDLPVGNYRVRAESSAYHREELPAAICSVKDRLRVRLNMRLILDEELRAFKEELIDILSEFPADHLTGEPRDVTHPYADTEIQALIWLDSQTELTQSLQRLVLAEWAAYDQSQQAITLAETAGTMTGALVRQVIEAVFSISYIKKYYELKIPAVFGIRQVLLDRLSSRSTMLISKCLKATGRVLSSLEEYEMVTKAMNGLLDNMLKNSSAGQGLYLNYHIKNMVSDKVKWSMLESYGDRTDPHLAYALSRATAGGPYFGDLEEDDSIVNSTLTASRSKTKAILNAVGNIDAMNAYIASPTHTGLSIIADMLGSSEEGACIKLLEMGYRGLEIYGTYSNLSMVSNRLRTTLPGDVRTSSREAFGEIGFETTAQKTISPKSTFKAPAKTTLPSITQLLTILETCQLALEENRMDDFESELPELITEMDTIESQSQLLLEQLALAGTESNSTRQARANEEFLRFFMEGQKITGAILDVLVTPSETTHQTCDDTLLRYRLGAQRLLSELQQCIPTVGSLELPPAAVISGLFFTTDLTLEETWINTSPQQLFVVANITNPSQLEAGDVDVTLALSPETGLLLEGTITLTQQIETLAADETVQVVWPMTYDGPLYSQPEYAEVSLSTPADSLVAVGQPVLTLLMTPWFPDIDEDGMDDRWEQENGLDPSTDDAEDDPDSDGLNNRQEMIHQTSPNHTDTDSDGINDGDEIRVGLNPTVNDSGTDRDGDGLNERQEITHETQIHNPDSDSDGASDGLEVSAGSDPNSADSTPDLSQLSEAIRWRLLHGWRQAGTDRAYLDTYRDGQLDLRDLYTARNATGEPTTQSGFAVTLNQSTQDFYLSRVPVSLTPAGELSAVLLEFTSTPDQIRSLAARANTGTPTGQMDIYQTEPNSLIMLIDSQPISPLSGDPNIAQLALIPASNTLSLDELNVQMVRGQAIDPSGQFFELPVTELTFEQEAPIPETSWVLY